MTAHSTRPANPHATSWGCQDWILGNPRGTARSWKYRTETPAMLQDAHDLDDKMLLIVGHLESRIEQLEKQQEASRFLIRGILETMEVKPDAES